MDKFEYGDLNRFLVSLGLALIFASLGVFWLFFREPFDLGRATEDIQKLTPLAQSVIEQRQEWTRRALAILPIVSSSGFVLGLVFLVIGLVRWIPMQSEYEKIQLATRKKLEQELRNMTPTEILEKAQTAVAMGGGLSGSTSAAPQVGQAVSMNAAVADYLATEAALLDALATRLPTDYVVAPHQKVMRYAFDALITSTRDPRVNFVLEIKQIPAGVRGTGLNDALRNASFAADWATMLRGTKHTPLVIAVTPDLNPTLVEASQQVVDRYNEQPTAVGRALLRLISPQRLLSLSAKDVETMLDPQCRFAVLGDQDPLVGG